MAKLFDKLMNRVIKGKLTIESDDDVSGIDSSKIDGSKIDFSEVDLNVKSINAKGGAISGPLAVTGNSAIGGDLDVNGDLRAKTLSQSQANYSFQFDLVASDSTNFERVSQYTRLEVVNGELHIIGLAKFHNTDTEAYHNFNLGLLTIQNIPDEIAEKIYTDNGVNIKTSNAGIIRIVPLGVSASSGVNNLGMRIYSLNPNAITFYNPSAVRVDAGTYITISFEANLSLF